MTKTLPLKEDLLGFVFFTTQNSQLAWLTQLSACNILPLVRRGLINGKVEGFNCNDRPTRARGRPAVAYQADIHRIVKLAGNELKSKILSRVDKFCTYFETGRVKPRNKQLSH